MVSVLAFQSDDASSNPAEVYNSTVKIVVKSTKLNKTDAEVGQFLRMIGWQRRLNRERKGRKRYL